MEKFKTAKWKKITLTLTVVFNLLTLGYFKYLDFFIENINTLFGTKIALLEIVLPIGISFYTFQTMSYVIDVYRGEVKATRNPFTLATYVTLFPQLIAGPIVRYQTVERELAIRKCTLAGFSYGVRRFVIGIGKKVLLANTFAELVKTITYSDEKTVLIYWISAIAFTFQIYFDFSGYSDMAIGLCRMFGFHIDENFNYPYISKSITEFWRRWHMSLSTWFRDYVYIPLGGNRVKKSRWLFNIVVVWLLTGFWHGASWNFIIWGLMYGVLLIFEKLFLGKLLTKIPKFVGLIYTMFFVVVGFVIFSIDDIAEMILHIKAMFGLARLPFLGEKTVYLLSSYSMTFFVAVVAATPICKFLADKFKDKPFMIIAEPIFICGLLLLSTGYLVDGSFNPFLYFRF